MWCFLYNFVATPSRPSKPFILLHMQMFFDALTIFIPLYPFNTVLPSRIAGLFSSLAKFPCSIQRLPMCTCILLVLNDTVRLLHCTCKYLCPPLSEMWEVTHCIAIEPCSSTEGRWGDYSNNTCSYIPHAKALI